MGIVTVSREVGSLGDEIAEGVAKELGYKLADRDYIHNLVKECDLEFSQACSAYESEVRPRGFMERMFFSNPAYHARFASLNYELASEDDVVIVGRGAQVPLSAVPGVLRVRVVAPLELRVERMSQRLNTSANEARDYVVRYGRERRALMESIYGKDLGDIYGFENFDLILNTAQFNAQEGVRVVAAALKELEQRSDAARRKALLKDLAFAKRVESLIKKSVNAVVPKDIAVEVLAPGKVRLTGLVSAKRNKELAEQIARQDPEVKEVVNELKTASLSF
ncbi:MAG: cytidylate kinase family protein [Thermodesulfobacteriota bacterium]